MSLLSEQDPSLLAVQSLIHTCFVHPYNDRREHVTFISVTLSRSLALQFSKIRLMIVDYDIHETSSPKLVRAITDKRLLRRLGMTTFYHLPGRHQLPKKINYHKSVEDDSISAVCVIALALTRDWGENIATLSPLTPTSKSNLSFDEPGRILLDETYSYSLERPPLAALESTFQIIGNIYSGLNLINMAHLHVIPIVPPKQRLHNHQSIDVVAKLASINSLTDSVLALIARRIPVGPQDEEWSRKRPNDGRNLLAVALVNQRFHRVILPILYSLIGRGHLLGLSQKQSQLSDSLARQPHLVPYMTHFDETEWMSSSRALRSEASIKGFRDLFGIATHLSHITLPLRLFRIVQHQLERLESVEGFLFLLQESEFRSTQTYLEVCSVLRRWRALKTLRITQYFSRRERYYEDEDAKALPVLPHGLTELTLHGGQITCPRFKSLLSSSAGTLQTLRLCTLDGLTNKDLFSVLFSLAPTLVFLEVAACNFRTQDKEEYAVDRTIHLMGRLNRLIVSDTLATPLSLTRLAQSLPLQIQPQSGSLQVKRQPVSITVQFSHRPNHDSDSFPWNLQDLSVELASLLPRDEWCVLRLFYGGYRIRRNTLTNARFMAKRVGVSLNLPGRWYDPPNETTEPWLLRL